MDVNHNIHLQNIITEQMKECNELTKEIDELKNQCVCIKDEIVEKEYKLLMLRDIISKKQIQKDTIMRSVNVMQKKIG
jgi:hypothetical protein